MRLKEKMNKAGLTMLLAGAMILVSGCGVIGGSTETLSGFQMVGSPGANILDLAPSEGILDEAYDITYFGGQALIYRQNLDGATDKTLSVMNENGEKKEIAKDGDRYYMTTPISDGTVIYYCLGRGSDDTKKVIKADFEGNKEDVTEIENIFEIGGFYDNCLYYSVDNGSKVFRTYEINSGEEETIGKGRIEDSIGKYLLIETFEGDAPEYAIYNAETGETKELPDNVLGAELDSEGLKYIAKEGEREISLMFCDPQLKKQTVAKKFQGDYRFARIGERMVTIVDNSTGYYIQYNYETQDTKTFDDFKLEPINYFAENVSRLDYTLDQLEYENGEPDSVYVSDETEAFIEGYDSSSILYEFELDTLEDIEEGTRLGRETVCYAMHGEAKDMLGIYSDMNIDIFEELTGVHCTYGGSACYYHGDYGYTSEPFFANDELYITVFLSDVKKDGDIKPDTEVCIAFAEGY